MKPGDKVEKYEIREAIGHGGHARVYHAYESFLERDVALKILHRPGGVTKDMLRRGQAEAKLLTRLRHPNIVEVIDAGLTEAGDLYIVMELLRGLSFREVLRQYKKVAVDEALNIFSKIADGVEAAHQKNAIHRDLKPENVFLVQHNTPKVLDFGIAKVVDAAGGGTTQKDVILGTVLYMSPEQIQGHGAIPRSDIFALGVMMYEALLGRHPALIENRSQTLKELAWLQTMKMPPLLHDLDPSIPPYVARFVNRAITKLPEQRFASMTDFAQTGRECLERYLRELSSRGGVASSRELSRSDDTYDRGPAEKSPKPGPWEVAPTRAEDGPALARRVAASMLEDPSLTATTARMSDPVVAGLEPSSPDAGGRSGTVYLPSLSEEYARQATKEAVLLSDRSDEGRVICETPEPVVGPLVRQSVAVLPVARKTPSVKVVLATGALVGGLLGIGGGIVALMPRAPVPPLSTPSSIPETTSSGSQVAASAKQVPVPETLPVEPLRPASSVEPAAVIDVPVAASAAPPQPAVTSVAAPLGNPSREAVVTRRAATAKKPTPRAPDKMEERLRWLEQDLQHDQSTGAPPSAEPSSPETEKPHLWFRPR